MQTETHYVLDGLQVACGLLLPSSCSTVISCSRTSISAGLEQYLHLSSSYESERGVLYLHPFESPPRFNILISLSCRRRAIN